MSKPELAGAAALSAATNTRYVEVPVPVLGCCRIRSLSTSEYMAIAGLESRALFALEQGKKADGERLLLDAKVKKIALCWVDADNKPVVQGAVGQQLRDLDYGVQVAFAKAIDRHTGADTEGLDLEGAGKNS